MSITKVKDWRDLQGVRRRNPEEGRPHRPRRGGPGRGSIHLETLRERLPDERPGSLAAHLPEELAAHLEGDGESEEFAVWEFFELFAQKVGITPEMATRYARHVGDVLGDAVPEEDHRYESFERRPDSLPPAAPVPDEN